MKEATKPSFPPHSAAAAKSADARIVAFGGGTGMSTLLRGLKTHTEKITAIVTVSDDGGSSGRLRKDYDIPPPGDIRNCLVALCDAGDLIEQLFQYRFEETDLKGHSFGNLFLTALTKVTGNFQHAIREANRILNVRGKVLPAAWDKVVVIAHHADGTKSTGEREIARSRSPIEKVSLRPEAAPLSDEIRQAVGQADVLLFGPGSLYTSVIPTLLNAGLAALLRSSAAYKIYVCNVMTQPGETPGYTAADHLAALEHHIGTGLVDCIIANTGEIPSSLRDRYAQEGAEPVVIDGDRITESGVRLVAHDVACNENYVRHNSDRLARVILAVVSERRRADG